MTEQTVMPSPSSIPSNPKAQRSYPLAQHHRFGELPSVLLRRLLKVRHHRFGGYPLKTHHLLRTRLLET